MFGSDFFKILEYIVAALRLFARIFGDDDDKKADDEAQSNHRHEVESIIRSKDGKDSVGS